MKLAWSSDRLLESYVLAANELGKFGEGIDALERPGNSMSTRLSRKSSPNVNEMGSC
jgi:hypothetical protein